MATTDAPVLKAWPRPLVAVILLVYVAVDAALWATGSYYAFLLDLAPAGQYLSLALALMLVGGWAWRWWVARGWIGGRPTARFA